MHKGLSRCIGHIILLLVIAGVSSSKATAQKKGGASPASSSPASSPSASAQGASGSNAPVEVEWLAYGALDQIMDKVADYSCSSNRGTVAKVLILDPPTLQALEAYDSFYAQAQAIDSAFVNMAPQSGAGGSIDDFADITGAVSAAAVASTSETSYTFTIQDPTAAIVLLGKLRRKAAGSTCAPAYYAGVYSVNDIAGATVNGQPLPSVTDELNSLASDRNGTLLTITGQNAALPLSWTL